MNNALLLLGRALLSIIFITAGWAKLTAISGTAGYFESLGLPAPAVLTVLSGLLEFFGGLAILVGFKTHWAAFTIAVFSVAAAFIGHYGQGGDNPVLVMMNQQALLKNFAIAGGLLVLAVFGPGALSVDAMLGKKKSLA
ncbi:DoxX family protein [Limoniibacter endophyticus]|uniref:Membrane protein n=1 Tax=Limoniibacter endophyticus TaxID=1565040 RepID=A0A8J3DGI0_9HYPH|nr:DoxX family protein [Limoniibacter endophyticus]GHC67796.1 membrane protein [Limoniibacter endophyticus]